MQCRMCLATLAFSQCQSGGDQSHVGECLGEIAQSVSAVWGNLLGKQSQVGLICQEALKGIVCLCKCSPTKCQVLDTPETADPECSFRRLTLITIEQAVARSQCLKWRKSFCRCIACVASSRAQSRTRLTEAALHPRQFHREH